MDLEMNGEAKMLLESLRLPESVILLLELFGIRSLEDLAMLDDEMISEVEESVKNGTFESFIDLDSKMEKLKFLGHDIKNIKVFKFRPLDRIKLQKVRNQATKQLQERETLNKTTQPTDELNLKLPTVEVAGEIIPEEVKIEGGEDTLNHFIVFENYEHADNKKGATTTFLDELNELTSEIVSQANESLKSINSIHEIGTEHVKVSITKGKFMAHVKCPDCCRLVSVNKTNEIACISMINFENHLMSRCNVQKVTETNFPSKSQDLAEFNFTGEVIEEKLIDDENAGTEHETFVENYVEEKLKNAEEISPKKAMETRRKRNRKVIRDENFDDNDEDEEMENLSKKEKRNILRKDIDVLKKEMESRVLIRSNEILDGTEFAGMLTENEVKIAFDNEKKVFSAQVKCPNCGMFFYLSFIPTSCSFGMVNYKRHLHRCGLKIKNWPHNDRDNPRQNIKNETGDAQKKIKKAIAKKENLRILKLKFEITEDRSFQCKECHKSFTTRKEANNHLKIHKTLPKGILCDLCGTTVKDRHTLKYHIRTHTGEKPHRCEVCDRGFATPSNLKNHLAVHSEDKPFTCDVCGLCCSTKRNLHYHTVQFHQQDLKINCSVCNKSFVSQNHLDCHMLHHTGEKKFSCTICQMKFFKSSHVQRHVQVVHLKVKWLQCEFCEKDFTRKDNYKVHLRSHHSKQVNDTEYQNALERLKELKEPKIDMKYVSDSKDAMEGIIEETEEIEILEAENVEM